MDTPKLRVDRLTRPVGVLVAGLLLAAIAACGSGEGGSEEGTSAAQTTSETPTTEIPTEPSESEESRMPDETTPFLDPSMGASDKPGVNAETTISGTVESGVETGCLVLTYEGTVYGIYGDYDSSIVYAGAEVTLHGHLEPDMMSFCQQGTPFVVEEDESAR